MYYFAGQHRGADCDVDKNGKFKEEIERMFFKRNEHSFLLKNNFGIGFKNPIKQDYIQKTCCNEIAVIFEGRIQNFLEVIKVFGDNLSRNLSFSEVILKLYKREGISFFSRLKGNYAFVIYDFKEDKVILHRDRLGGKPLYYNFKNKILVFGTSLMPIFKSGLVKKEINLKRIYNYFSLNSLSTGDDTEFKDIFNLLPGEIVSLCRGKIKKNIVEIVSCNNFPSSEREIEEELFTKIKSGLENHFSIYKKASIAFSGGLDTNVIANFAYQKGIPINTFTLKFDSRCLAKNRDYKIAKKRSKKYNTAHHELRVTQKNFVKNIDDKMRPYERLTPISFFNNDYIYEFVSQHDDIVFTGDGVEEQLGFYPWVHLPYGADLLLNNTFKDRDLVYKKLADSTINHFFNLSSRDNRFAKDSIFSKDFLLNLGDYYPSDYVGLCRYSNEKSKDNLIYLGILNIIFYLSMRNMLIPNKIISSDFLSRKYSLEICAPYLGEDIVNFLEKVPASLKYKGYGHDNSKYIYRKAVSRIIGKDAFINFKSGSNLPLGEWMLDNEFEKKIREVLDCARVEKSGILNPKEVKKILDEHYSNRNFYDSPRSPKLFKKGVDHHWKIIKLFSFQLWWENNFEV